MAENRRSTRRTDEIRRRRKSQSRQAKLGRRKPKTTSQTPPPVMTRYTTPVSARGESGRRKGKSEAGVAHRRRYDVTLDNQGTEMRLPALPRVRVGWRVISLALVALLGYVL